MKKVIFIILATFVQFVFSQTHIVLDATTKESVSYATISFGNGNGLFANEDGVFGFSKKRYQDIDSLYISALGHQELAVSTYQLPSKIFLTPEIAELKEVVVTAETLGSYKTKKQNAIVHKDYFKSWLPTVESEIAVYFLRPYLKPTKIASVYLPIILEDSRGESGKKDPFSTLLKMQFYQNDNGMPGLRLPVDNIIFRITEKNKSNFELDVSEHKIFIPKEGIFISIQVLGYTDNKGKLQNTKKYHEVETDRGIVKIPTTFRPLLPFTNTIENNNTFARRIFFKNRTWQRFDKNYSEGNNLIRINYMNYGMGLKMHVYTK